MKKMLSKHMKVQNDDAHAPRVVPRRFHAARVLVVVVVVMVVCVGVSLNWELHVGCPPIEGGLRSDEALERSVSDNGWHAR